MYAGKVKYRKVEKLTSLQVDKSDKVASRKESHKINQPKTETQLRKVELINKSHSDGMDQKADRNNKQITTLNKPGKDFVSQRSWVLDKRLISLRFTKPAKEEMMSLKIFTIDH